jgi:NADH dehydrogenase
VETIVHCAAITADKKEAYRGQYHDVNAKGTRNLVAAAREAGVRRIVLLNGLGTRPGSEGSYMRTRWEMAEAVRGSGLSWTALQPSILFGDSAPFPAAIARLARQFPVVPVLGGGRKLQPMWIEDLVTCLIQSVNDPRRDGQTIDLGGPDQMTFAEIDGLILETIKLRRLTLPLPVPMARIAAGVMSVLPNPPLVPATLELFDFDNTTDLDAVSRNFGFEPRSIRTHFKEHGLGG